MYSTLTDWFEAARFGTFIHWGPMSIGGCCWPQARMSMTDEDYAEAYVATFQPDLFDPVDWAARAWAAGMRYVVIVAKHHDGFCMWDTKETTFSAPHTAAATDLLRPIVEAFRERGFRIGLYYSLLDWHHPDFTLDSVHPDREQIDANPGERDFSRYLSYLRAQVRELLTEYGVIDYLWFDFSYEDVEWTSNRGTMLYGKGGTDWESEQLEEMCRELQPEILLNDRLGLGRGVATPEQNRPDAPIFDTDGTPRLWELCDTHNTSWTYNRDDLAWKTPLQVATTLMDVVAKGGNFLFNVGPTPRGEVPAPTRMALEALAGWARSVEPAIRASRSSFTPPPGCLYTQAGDRLFVTVLVWQQHLALPGLLGRVSSARTLDDGFEIKLRPHKLRSQYSDDTESLVFELPLRPHVLLPVIELRLTSADAV